MGDLATMKRLAAGDWDYIRRPMKKGPLGEVVDPTPGIELLHKTASNVVPYLQESGATGMIGDLELALRLQTRDLMEERDVKISLACLGYFTDAMDHVVLDRDHVRMREEARMPLWRLIFRRRFGW